jgi:non-specific serine/threonine protein kinase
VETHVTAIFDKYGVSSRVALTAARVGARADANGAANAPPRMRTNLPHRRADLIGRDAEIDELVRLLTERRLVSVIGTGGVGKTSVAQAVGRRCLASEMEVWFVELAPVSDASEIVHTLARTLNVHAGQNAVVVDAVCAHIERRNMLVVFDNCEHLTDGVAALADALLGACPLLRLLVTSREPLRIAAERTYRLPPLRVPTSHEAIALRAETGVTFAAIALFVERARAADHTFVLSDDNVTIVAEICHRLDGVPLAIELAAARVTILSVRALATRLDRQLDLLTGGSRIVAPRHQTMRALIDWSFDLLSEPERRLFERLSVFAGGCALHEAAAVYGDAGDDEDAVFELLSSLAAKSLIVVDRDGRETRYGLFETSRQYAAERLTSQGDASIVMRRHAVAYAALAEQLFEHYEFGPTAVSLARAEAEAQNLRVALEWAFDANNDVRLGQRIVASTRGIGASREKRFRYVRVAYEFTDDRTPRGLVARLELARAVAAYIEQQLADAVSAAKRAIDAFASLDDVLGLGIALSTAGHALVLLGLHDEAESFIERALSVAGSARPAAWTALALQGAGRIAFSRRDVARGRECVRRAQSIYLAIGAARHAAAMNVILGECEFEAGNVELAYETASAALPAFVKAGDTITLAAAHVNLATCCIELRRWKAARHHAREGLDAARSARYVVGIACALQHLAGIVCFSEGDEERVVSPYGDVARVVGYVDATLARIGASHEANEQREHDRIVDALRANISPDALSSLLAAGAAMAAERAFELALSLDGSDAREQTSSA